MTQKPITYFGTVIDKKVLTPTVFELFFSPLSAFPFQPGQFISVHVPVAERFVKRAYSIASASYENILRLCIKKVEGGKASTYLAQLQKGDVFQFSGPYGHFTLKKNDVFIYWIATGTGIAPFRSMALSYPNLNGICLLGVQTTKEIIYENDFQALPLVQYHVALSQEPTEQYFYGRVTDYLKKCAYQKLNTDFYLCGHGSMIHEVKQILLEQGVTKQNIYQEKYY